MGSTHIWLTGDGVQHGDGLPAGAVTLVSLERTLGSFTALKVSYAHPIFGALTARRTLLRAGKRFASIEAAVTCVEGHLHAIRELAQQVRQLRGVCTQPTLDRRDFPSA